MKLKFPRRAFLAGAALSAGLALAGASASAQDTHSFKMATGWSGGPLMEIGAKAFAENVERMSDGRITIEVFPAGTLGPGLKVSETVNNGVAEMGHTWIGYDWGIDPTAVLFGGFAGSFDSERMLHWLYRGGGADMQAAWRMERFNLVSMPLFIRTSEVFLHSRKPVRTLEDLQGLKLRTAGAWLEISKSMGAAPVTMPGGDVYPALERGAIDATEWGTLWENISPGFHRVTKYVIIPGVHQPTAPFELVINNDAWNSLSESDQALIRDAAFKTTMDSWLTIGQEDAKALAFFREQGNEVIELDPEVQYEAREAGLAWAEEKAAENDWFKRVLESQKEFADLWKDSGRYRNVKVRQ
ncbi:TRAP transporter substrate-binding protein DctP [Dichotomicrobium thermohalophilum]|uniref:TRAP-type mannitol/chloroaromatic compound transport system substrate-binding protein n=1 Tax=Dichotomicrobium thermohalophilum TaxID=933063 RepID=A0A397PIF7_9HYPH|nr:TRAP transporter substrate-binding protein DctP [Dichotomicrobium thermohalophilum]RIA47669.1 TRAP-type mannitol/chloroaromatic compound transport system substrate-binding protein [Dichotomicrobium thermohalophilum]